MLEWSPLLGGVFLGWALGANDAANVFGIEPGLVRNGANDVGRTHIVYGACLQAEPLHAIGRLVLFVRTAFLRWRALSRNPVCGLAATGITRW